MQKNKTIAIKNAIKSIQLILDNLNKKSSQKSLIEEKIY